MRIVFVWLTAFTLLFAVSMGWYVSLPVVLSMSNGLKPQITEARGLTLAVAVEYVSYVWGPLCDVFIVLWAILNSQKRDVESEAYSY